MLLSVKIIRLIIKEFIVIDKSWLLLNFCWTFIIKSFNANYFIVIKKFVFTFFTESWDLFVIEFEKIKGCLAIKLVASLSLERYHHQVVCFKLI